MANKRKFKGEGMTYDEAIVHYQNYDMKVEDIAKAVGVCTRQIEREAKKSKRNAQYADGQQRQELWKLIISIAIHRITT